MKTNVALLATIVFISALGVACTPGIVQTATPSETPTATPSGEMEQWAGLIEHLEFSSQSPLPILGCLSLNDWQWIASTLPPPPIPPYGPRDGALLPENLPTKYLDFWKEYRPNLLFTGYAYAAATLRPDDRDFVEQRVSEGIRYLSELAEWMPQGQNKECLELLLRSEVDVARAAGVKLPAEVIEPLNLE